MAQITTVPSRADLLKIQAKHAVIGKETSGIGAAVQKIEALGKAAYTDINPRSKNNLFKISELADKLEIEIHDYGAKYGKKNPKFTTALTVEFIKPIEEIRRLAQDLATKNNRLYKAAHEAWTALGTADTGSRPSSDRSSLQYGDIATKLQEAGHALSDLAGEAGEVAIKLGGGPYQKLATDINAMANTVKDIRKYCEAKSNETAAAYTDEKLEKVLDKLMEKMQAVMVTIGSKD